MNAALACGIVLAIALIIALLTNNAYNRAKGETDGTSKSSAPRLETPPLDTHQGFTPRPR